MPDVRRPASQAIDPTSNMVTVRVSWEDLSQDFLIHDSFLCKSSDFFAAALRGEWRESTERVVPLPAVLPEHFKLYYNWIYTGKIYSAPDGHIEKALKFESGTLFKKEMSSLIQCWILGHRLLDIRFTDTVMDTLILVGEDYPGYIDLKDDLKAIYTETMPRSSLRCFVTEYIVHCCKDKTLTETYGDVSLPEDFLKDLLSGLIEFRPYRIRPAPSMPRWRDDPCEFHEHTREGKPCWTTT
ncbi:uncharacterized protein BDZ99DRAFT_564724 [Mytilinidion resinicola]|uniref:BTB domain-containing protein n=1 Tax=Mytilinidion resinicola TaxID=574789 RepID=A0A6A6Z720_9PEZI|nr:uncharacterized protein BDZ99DRAFT_564724 [Mytilinidion resinicola]KAF2816902.1 hypothetical protein BDZ99DRAFT_564724 [Mytilinidion resinicola]